MEASDAVPSAEEPYLVKVRMDANNMLTAAEVTHQRSASHILSALTAKAGVTNVTAKTG